jgi:AraC-like DNA-binding protein
MQEPEPRWSHFDSHHTADRWRTALVERVINVDVKPLSDTPFRAAIDLVDLGSLSVVAFDMSPVAMSRTGRHVTDGYDGFALSVATETTLVACQSGDEYVVQPGEAVLMDARRPSDLAGQKSLAFLGFRISRPWFNRFSFARPESARMLLRNPALDMLTVYASRVAAGGGMANASLAPMFESHVSELLAAAMIAGGAAAPSDEAALTDVRYRCISEALRHHAQSQDLTLPSLSARLGMSERSIQLTLARHGTSFSDLLRSYRLTAALSALQRGQGSITSVAFSVGFQDLSTFNRAFKTAFGMRPSDVTPAALQN